MAKASSTPSVGKIAQFGEAVSGYCLDQGSDLAGKQVLGVPTVQVIARTFFLQAAELVAALKGRSFNNRRTSRHWGMP